MNRPLKKFLNFMNNKNIDYEFKEESNDKSSCTYTLRCENISVSGKGINDSEAMQVCVKKFLAQRYNVDLNLFDRPKRYLKDDAKEENFPEEIVKLIKEFQAKAYLVKSTNYRTLSGLLNFKPPESATLNTIQKEENYSYNYKPEPTKETYELLKKIIEEMQVPLQVIDDDFDSDSDEEFSSKQMQKREYQIALEVHLDIACTSVKTGVSRDEALYAAAAEVLLSLYMYSLPTDHSLLKHAKDLDNLSLQGQS